MKKFTLFCLVALPSVVGFANITPAGTGTTGIGPFTWSYRLDLHRTADRLHTQRRGAER